MIPQDMYEALRSQPLAFVLAVAACEAGAMVDETAEWCPADALTDRAPAQVAS